MATEVTPDPDGSLAAYERRMHSLRDELHSINKELGQVDLLALAHRTEDLLLQTKGLLDGNVTILFHNQPDRSHEDLYKQLEYARGHIEKALGEEFQFDVIKQRLYMANSLCEYVIQGIARAIERLKREGY
ncbi:MAG: hypothetical protein NVS2B16_15230 [Chloroflexota bacterium]